ncbi:hypothetical protein [Pseudomonas sp. Pc102]|uniref:hypothetical protein n=1 Tax=Pseudomonas sp. Pc102 TaxID=2678261 RepID=UPI001BD04FF3|nr:hypothetical protein [Pseudomonas sp. Pc102]
MRLKFEPFEKIPPAGGASQPMRLSVGYAPERTFNVVHRMRTSSRQTPQAMHGKPALKLRYRLLAIALLGGALTAFWMQPDLLVVAAMLVLAGVIQHHADLRHFRRMAELRHGESICQFARSFPRREVDTSVVRAVYEELHAYLGGTVPIRVGDHLDRDLRVDSEDLDLDLIEAMAARCGRTLEDCELNPWFGKVDHVQDLVRFLEHQPSLPALARTQ